MVFQKIILFLPKRIVKKIIMEYTTELMDRLIKHINNKFQEIKGKDLDLDNKIIGVAQMEVYSQILTILDKFKEDVINDLNNKK